MHNQMEPISLVFESFINLADGIINLEKTKLQNKQQAFKEIIEPLFIELQTVVDNYVNLFKKAKQSIAESSQKDLSVAVREIREARESMILNRIKVRELANRIQEVYNDKKIIDFALKVQEFFYRTIVQKQTKMSYAKELVDLFEYVAKNDMDKSDLIEFMNDALKNMENSWVAIAQSYALVRIYCLSSPQLTHKPKDPQ